MRVTDPILPLLAGIACLLLALAAAEAWGGARIRHGIGLGAACLSGWGALLALIDLVMGNPPVRLALPIGPPAAVLSLGLDPLAAFALVLVLLAGAAVIAFAAEQPPPSRGTPPPSLAAPIAMLPISSGYSPMVCDTSPRALISVSNSRVVASPSHARCSRGDGNS